MTNNSPWTQTLAGRPDLGSRAERSRTTTMRDVEMFTEMTGDKNPIHYDADLAAKSTFGGLIVQGGHDRSLECGCRGGSPGTRYGVSRDELAVREGRTDR